jgi:hypothetical protein
MKTNYKVNILSSNGTTGTGINNKLYYFDWEAILPSNVEYLLEVSFSSSNIVFGTAAALPVLYSNMLSGISDTMTNSTYTEQQFLCMPITYIYSASQSTTFRCDSDKSNPLYLAARPNRNNFAIDIIDSNSIYTYSTINVNYLLILNFKPFIRKINTTQQLYNPFNIIIKSIYGTALTTKSNMQFQFDFGQKYSSGLKYKMYFILSMMACNTSSAQMIVVKSNIIRSNTNWENSVSSMNNASQIIGIALCDNCSTVASVRGDNSINPPIICELSSSSTVLIQFYDLSNTIWAPTTGSTPDWIMDLYFEPIIN